MFSGASVLTPLHRVLDGGIGETRHQRGLVARQVDARHRRQGWPRLALHQGDHEPGDQRIGHRFVDRDVIGQTAHARHGKVAGVEQPQLHELIRGHVPDELGTDILPGRPARREAVLDHPLGKGLGKDRPAIHDAVALGQACHVRRRRHGGDPVDHGVGKAAMLSDPSSERRVAQGCQREDGIPAAHGHCAGCCRSSWR